VSVVATHLGDGSAPRESGDLWIMGPVLFSPVLSEKAPAFKYCRITSTLDHLGYHNHMLPKFWESRTTAGSLCLRVSTAPLCWRQK